MWSAVTGTGLEKAEPPTKKVYHLSRQPGTRQFWQKPCNNRTFLPYFCPSSYNRLFPTNGESFGYKTLSNAVPANFVCAWTKYHYFLKETFARSSDDVSEPRWGHPWSTRKIQEPEKREVLGWTVQETAAVHHLAVESKLWNILRDAHFTSSCNELWWWQPGHSDGNRPKTRPFDCEKISKWKRRGRVFTGTHKGKSPNPANIEAMKSETAVPQTLDAESETTEDLQRGQKPHYETFVQ